MPTKQLKENQIGAIKRLVYAYDRGDEILKERSLNLRTKNLDDIALSSSRFNEQRRQNFSKYVGEQFDALVMDILKSLGNSDELIHKFEYVDLGGHSKTSANILEKKMSTLQEIIRLLKQNPEKYAQKDSFIDRNTRYKKDIGVLTQSINSCGLSGDSKVVLDYLWGKRKITYHSKFPDETGRPVSMRSLQNNTEITSTERLVNIIDQFNKKAAKEELEVKIVRGRTKKTVQLKVIDDFPTTN